MDEKVEVNSSSSKYMVGEVISSSMVNTVVVKVERKVKHIKYGKYIKRSTKLYAHDAGNNIKVGQKVKLVETRPMSKLKRWNVVEVVGSTKV